ncbi:MAG TPA: type II toxin-antitoxin system VapC family toxin [Acetobacteraceae bacterium]|nr:type II toxin-antitoxin system VapC family toxin [Acetobacteraceae bacterium]
MSAFVLDNSVTMRWCFDSGAHAYAAEVLARPEARQSVTFVPVLWRYEVSAVLARAQIRALLPARQVTDFFAEPRCARYPHR